MACSKAYAPGSPPTTASRLLSHGVNLVGPVITLPAGPDTVPFSQCFARGTPDPQAYWGRHLTIVGSVQPGRSAICAPVNPSAASSTIRARAATRAALSTGPAAPAPCRGNIKRYIRQTTSAVSPQHVGAIRAAEARDECGSGRWPDLNVGAEGREQWREGRGIGVFEVKGFQGEPGRR
jgi:hypothetical protein